MADNVGNWNKIIQEHMKINGILGEPNKQHFSQYITELEHKFSFMGVEQKDIDTILAILRNYE
jgi:hypothetical protein